MKQVYRLETIVTQARVLSPYYSHLYRDVPWRGWQLSDLPVVDGPAYWAANRFQDNQVATAPVDAGIVFKSGGTTGQPKFVAYSHQEWLTFARVNGQLLSNNGFRDGDRVANLFYGGDLYTSFLFVTDSINHSGQKILQFPIGGDVSASKVIAAIREFGINVLVGLPTTFVDLSRHLTSQRQPCPEVERIRFAGEILFDDMQAVITQAFPEATARSIGYASVDAGFLGFADDSCGPNEHRTAEEQNFVEIVDDVTGEVIDEPGCPGLVVSTNLTRLLVPVIRYPVGDRAVWTEPAGTAHRKFRLLGRSERGARLGPVSLDYADLRRIVYSFADRYDIRNLQLRLTRVEGRDHLTLRVATGHEPGEQATQEVLSEIYRQRPPLAEERDAGHIAPVKLKWCAETEMVTNARTGKSIAVEDLRLQGGAS
jgi:phenylacetate-CoA ligase